MGVYLVEHTDVHYSIECDNCGYILADDILEDTTEYDIEIWELVDNHYGSMPQTKINGIYYDVLCEECTELTGPVCIKCDDTLVWVEDYGEEYLKYCFIYEGTHPECRQIAHENLAENHPNRFSDLGECNDCGLYVASAKKIPALKPILQMKVSTI